MRRWIVPRVVVVPVYARGFRWTTHKNKYGQDYPTNAGYERY